MILNKFFLPACTLGSLVAAVPSALAQPTPESVARRIATLSAVAVEEYALGVVGGEVVSAGEFDEARLFLAEARQLAEQLPEAVRDSVVHRLSVVVAAANRFADPADLADGVARIREVLATGLEISLDPPPGRPVALGRGAEVYAGACATCHGAKGAGDGPAAPGLDPPPAAFTERAALTATSPLDFFRKVTVGVAGTAMAGFENRLSLDDRWAVSLYVSGLRYEDADRAEGRRWLAAECRVCLVDVSDGRALLGVSDDSLAVLLAARAGAQVPAAAVAFARTAGAADVLGSDRVLAARRVAARVDTLVTQAAALARSGARERASSLVLDAYLVFEAVERDVAARDGRAAVAAEQAFGTLRATIARGDVAGLARSERATRNAVAEAVAVLEVRSSGAVLFGQSLLIIVREGLEAILILGALTTLLKQAGSADRTRDLGVGVGLAIAASLGTAALFATVLRVSAAQQEAVEGITMLLASIVLFSVASWMVSKVEAARWQAFVRQRLRSALAGRSVLALAGVAFLAVYREGVETVLFYAALLGTAEGTAGSAAVAAGFLVGLFALAVVYVGMQRWGMRIPIRPFFAVTGGLLTVMAVSFAGQGVAELQVAGWIPTTPIRLPALPALGVFPTVQTVLAQALIGTAFLVAVWWIMRSADPRRSPAG